MKNYGFRKVTIQFLGGVEIVLLARYFARDQRRAEKGKGIYFALALLGIHDKCSPALASEVAKLAAAMNSLEDARTQLAKMRIQLSGKQIAQSPTRFRLAPVHSNEPKTASDLSQICRANELWSAQTADAFAFAPTNKANVPRRSPPLSDRLA